MTCKSCEFPRPELPNTLEAFAKFIPEIVMWPKDNVRWVEIAGATFEYSKVSDTPYLSLGAAVGLENGLAIKFESPALSVDMEHSDINTAVEWRQKYDALAKMLHDEIIMYAEGKRAQTELEFEEEGQGNDTTGKDN